jgi:hypothetical protein
MQVNVREPSLPIQLASRGKASIVPSCYELVVGDHDFHLVNLTRSVTLLTEVKENLDGGLQSLYKGKYILLCVICVRLRFPIDRVRVLFYFRDCTRVLKILDFLGITSKLARLHKKKFPGAVAMIMYTDGGPDHNCKHNSVRLGLLALFFELDLDTMVVLRIAPTQSWCNPVERVMSILNLGLQGVALDRHEMP